MKTRQDIVNDAKAVIKEITIQTARDILEKGQRPVLLDVRAKEEYEAGHLVGAVHIPRGLLELQAEEKLPQKSRPVVVYCAAGVRSALAARTLQEMGYTDVSSLLGGYDEWASAQYDVESHGEEAGQTKALEREVALLERKLEERRKQLQSLKTRKRL